MSPLVSVVLPTHDRPRELLRAIRSVQWQTQEDWELIVVDDASRPPAAKALAEILAVDGRITSFRLDPGAGVSAARNAAVERARGEWIAFLDDDDLWAPGKLAEHVAAASAASAAFVYGTVLHVTEDGTLLYESPFVPAAEITTALLRTNAIGGPSNVIVRADALRASGGFRTELEVSADWDLWLRLAEAGPAAALARAHTAVLQHPGNMQLVLVDRIEHELAALAERHRPAQERHGMELGAGGTEVWLAAKRWEAAPGVRTGAGYVAAALRHRQAGRVARGVLRRRLRLERRRPAPPWVLELLGAGGGPAVYGALVPSRP